MNSNDNEPMGAFDALTIRGDDGRPVLMIGLLATLYCEHGWTHPIREAVTDLAEVYLNRFQDQLKWAQHPTSARMYTIASKSVARPREWLPQHEEGAEWFFGFHGGDTPSEASAFQVSASAASEQDGHEPGELHFHLPLNYFAEHGGTLAEFLLPICKRLKPLSGIAGIGVLEPLSLMAAGEQYPLVRELGEQHPGLDIHSVMTCNDVGTGIKGVNWLTILGERWIKEMGGLDYLRMRLDEPTFPFYSYDGGVIIQAGPHPQIGDVTKDLWPNDYITLHKVLKKIQIKDTYAFHFKNQPNPRIMDRNASRAWLFRFDGK